MAYKNKDAILTWGHRINLHASAINQSLISMEQDWCAKPFIGIKPSFASCPSWLKI